MLLMSALALAFALWAMGTSQQSTGGGRLLGWVPLVAFLAASPFAAAHLQSAGQAAPVNLSALPSEPFTQARLDAYRAQHRAVFVTATAAWCVTCMVNDKVAIDDSRVRAAFAAHRVAYLVADWTRRNAAVTAILNAYGRSGVPLYIYYAPGATEAKILPQILTPDEILGTIDGR
jgi:thiol:disulfide interchange protein DsbD